MFRNTTPPHLGATCLHNVASFTGWHAFDISNPEHAVAALQLQLQLQRLMTAYSPTALRALNRSPGQHVLSTSTAHVQGPEPVITLPAHHC